VISVELLPRGTEIDIGLRLREYRRFGEVIAGWRSPPWTAPPA
jgi:hypothetical protein